MGVGRAAGAGGRTTVTARRARRGLIGVSLVVATLAAGACTTDATSSAPGGSTVGSARPAATAGAPIGAAPGGQRELGQNGKPGRAQQAADAALDHRRRLRLPSILPQFHRASCPLLTR